MKPLTDARIVESWNTNAAAWTRAVREGAIESRRLVTDAAIVEAVMRSTPRTVLDVGCGEGWLARALAARGVDVTGIDVVPELVERARAADAADTSVGRARCNFDVLAYEDLGRATLGDERFDVAVCNFSLLGKESVEGLLRALTGVLAPSGRLVVQTLHSAFAVAEEPYRDGWRAGSWAGFDDSFTDPAPWYFRTVGGWLRLLDESGYCRIQVDEPLHPRTGRPASMILSARVA